MPPDAGIKNFPLGWEEFHRDAIALASRLANKGPWKGMVVVTRGGLVPACIVARALGIRVIETISIVGYHHDTLPGKASKAEILKYPAGVGDGAGWLVIDELVDTGRTAEIVRQLMPKAHIAAVYVKPLGRPLADTFVAEVSQDTWINFPWEVE